MFTTVEKDPTKVNTEPEIADETQIKVMTTPLPDTETAGVESSTETEWKITIKSSDGATSELLLSPVSAKSPRRQEINIYMPKSKAEEDLEKAKEEPAPPSKKMRYYTMVQQFLTAIFSVVIIVIEVLTLVKYRQTQNVAGAWPTNPLLTPTYVLLVMAVLSCTADIITFGVNCCIGPVKNSMMNVVAKIRGSMGILQAIASASGAGYFKWANLNSGNNDLWGWSCSDAAAAQQSITTTDQLCNQNAAAFALAILQVVLHVLTVVMAVWALLNPEGSFKDHSAEAAGLLSDSQAQETKIQSEFGDPAKK